MMQITLAKAGITAGYLIALGTVGGFGTTYAVRYVGGPDSPYAGKSGFETVAQAVTGIRANQPAILSVLVQNQAAECDDRVDVLKLQAKAERSQVLADQAKQKASDCAEFHKEADKATRALLGH
jgi:hypothetical protein